MKKISLFDQFIDDNKKDFIIRCHSINTYFKDTEVRNASKILFIIGLIFLVGMIFPPLIILGLIMFFWWGYLIIQDLFIARFMFLFNTFSLKDELKETVDGEIKEKIKIPVKIFSKILDQAFQKDTNEHLTKAFETIINKKLEQYDFFKKLRDQKWFGIITRNILKFIKYHEEIAKFIIIVSAQFFLCFTLPNKDFESFWKKYFRFIPQSDKKESTVLSKIKKFWKGILDKIRGFFAKLFDTKNYTFKNLMKLVLFMLKFLFLTIPWFIIKQIFRLIFWPFSTVWKEIKKTWELIVGALKNITLFNILKFLLLLIFSPIIVPLRTLWDMVMDMFNMAKFPFVVAYLIIKNTFFSVIFVIKNSVLFIINFFVFLKQVYETIKVLFKIDYKALFIASLIGIGNILFYLFAFSVFSIIAAIEIILISISVLILVLYIYNKFFEVKFWDSFYLWLIYIICIFYPGFILRLLGQSISMFSGYTSHKEMNKYTHKMLKGLYKSYFFDIIDIEMPHKKLSNSH